jgi:hypothetical protein
MPYCLTNLWNVGPKSLRSQVQLCPAFAIGLRMNEEPPLALDNRQRLSSTGMQRQPRPPRPDRFADGQKAILAVPCPLKLSNSRSIVAEFGPTLGSEDITALLLASKRSFKVRADVQPL